MCSLTTENLDKDSSCVEVFRDLQLHAYNKKVGEYILIFLADFFQWSEKKYGVFFQETFSLIKFDNSFVLLLLNDFDFLK